MTTTTQPLYLCIYVPELPIQALLRHRPKDMSCAIAVLDGVAPLELVCSATHYAFKKGVVRGMTRVQLDSFDNVTVLSRSLTEEYVARDVLVDLADTFTPRVQMLPMTTSACELVLDMAGSTKVFRSPEQILRLVHKALQTNGMHAHLAMSSNFHTAVCAAPYASYEGIIIPPGKERFAMRDLPLAALRLAEHQATTFIAWGLSTCGDLAALPDIELISRMGQDGKALQLLARGERLHLFIPERVAFRLEEHADLEEAVDLLDYVMWFIQPMLQRLIERAATQSLGLASVTVTLTLDQAALHIPNTVSAVSTDDVRAVRPALPLSDLDVLAKMLYLDLQAHPPSAPVKSIHVHAEPGTIVRAQLSFFSPPDPEPVQLDVTLARIAALVGADHVGRARLRDTHLPDDFTLDPFLLSAGGSTCPSIEHTPSVVVRRLRPPVTLRIKEKDGRPFAFPMSGQQYFVEEAQGPWRLSGSWWSQAIWSRDEWDIRALSPDGKVLLGTIAQDLLGKHWHLTAQYD